MKLNLENILARADYFYADRKMNKPLGESEQINYGGIRSDQVKALAQALVEAINLTDREDSSLLIRE